MIIMKVKEELLYVNTRAVISDEEEVESNLIAMKKDNSL